MEQEDFDIKITYRDVKNFETQYEDSWRIENKNYLDGFDMIIIGFRDVYDNIPDNSVKVGEETKPSPAEAILQFIEDGKSVIFSHDTTSFVNRDRRIYGDLDTKNKEIPDISWEGDKTRGLDDWGYSLNSKLRTAVGMDRYGIVSNKQFKGTPVKDILKKGLTLPIADDDIDKGSKVSISDINNLVGDMAFEPNRTQEKTVAEVQGFTNHVVKSGNSNIKTTSKVTKVNEGAITIYPYEIPPLFQCAQTHSQYYQLALEENSNDDGVNDIVVWYCLAAGENNTYGKSPNDVRNNYYFYSKGNVIYTGVGHSSVDGADNEFEKKLFVNAIVAAASVTAVQPQVEFIKSFYPGSERELYRYYMTDYHLLSNKDSGNILDNEQMFNFSVRDYNMVAASLDSNSNIGKMKVELYIENEHGEIEDEKIGKGIKLSQITGVPLFKYNGTGNPTKIDPSKGGVYELSENGTYQFTVSDLEKFLWDSQNGFKDNVKIYVKVSNTVKLYGKDVQKVSVDSIVLKQRQLFDLD